MEQNHARDRGHVWYFDLLRLFALTCVILTHAASGPLRGARNLGWGVLAATAGILVVSWLLSKTLCTVPWVCYAVSGMPFSRARKTCSWLAMGKNSGQGSP